MGEKRRSQWQIASVVAAGMCLLATAALFAADRVHGPTWVKIGAGVIVGVLAMLGKRAMEALGFRWAAAVEQLNRRSVTRGELLRQAPLVVDAGHQLALSIHPAIPLPETADSDLSGNLPEYIERRIDADIRAWIKGHTRSGGLIVLVGPATAGKTRSLYEALRTEVPDWLVPKVGTGAQLNAAVEDGVDLSQSVIWLDELQNFFADETLTASSVRQLILGRSGPVLLAATIRSEELDRLLHGSSPEDETTGPHVEQAIGYTHAQQVVKMLARWSPRSGTSERAIRFHVDSQLTRDELSRARALAEIDPRIASALAGSQDGRVTATLAGAPDLIERWTLETSGDPNGQALITAAVVARRCGYPEPIPRNVLESLAVLYLAEQSKAPQSTDWLPPALTWAIRPIEGRISALSEAITRPGVVDGFRVSDVLVQHSYGAGQGVVDHMLAREETWASLIEQVEPSIRTLIGVSAEWAGNTEMAQRAWRSAADDDDVQAMHWLGRIHTDGGDHQLGAAWFRRAAERGFLPSMTGLASCLHEQGDSAEAVTWLRQAADRGSTSAIVSLGLRMVGQGNLAEGERWYRQAAELEDARAMANLGYLLMQRGDLDEAEHWNRRGALLGHTGAIENLATICLRRGETDRALDWFRRGAEFALTKLEESPQSFQPWPGEAADDGISNVILGLAETLLERGESAETEEAEYWLRLIAERGDPRAAAALAARLSARGEAAGAHGWRQKAAESADSLLNRARAVLLDAYGLPGPQAHIDIILTHATSLDEEGNSVEAHAWRAKATLHSTP